MGTLLSNEEQPVLVVSDLMHDGQLQTHKSHKNYTYNRELSNNDNKDQSRNMHASGLRRHYKLSTVWESAL